MRKGRGISRRSEKLLARGKWTNVPLTLLILATCVTHVLRSEDRVKSWVNILILPWDAERFERQKPKIWDKNVLKFR